MNDARERKEKKAIDSVKEWLKSSCTKGETVEIIKSENMLVIRRLVSEEPLTFAYKRVSPKGRKGKK